MTGKAIALDTPADSGLRERARPSFVLRFGTREISLKNRSDLEAAQPFIQMAYEQVGG